MIEMSHLSIVEALFETVEEIEVDCNQLECFELSKIEKIEIEIFN